MRIRFLPLILVFAAIASAHPEGFSGLKVKGWPDKAHARLTMQKRDLSRWFPPAKYKDYVNDVCGEIVKKPEELMDIQFDDKSAAAVNVNAFSPDVGIIEVDLDFPFAHPP